jgi:hypothetical protein
VTVGKKEDKKTVTEYYHRAVVAHLVGLDLPIVLDVEMVQPGEGETVAARRLLERLMKRYARFFDAVGGDAIYWEAPLAQLCRKHGKHLLAVLKENNPALLADARAVLTGEADLTVEEKGRQIRHWDQEGFTSGAAPEAVRVVRTEERWTRCERVAGKSVHTPQRSEWFWASTISQALMPPRQLRQAGHERWKIENSIFNALGAHWALDHCFHHDPHAIVNFILILAIAHILVACFHRRNMKQPARQRLTLIAVATEILLGILSMPRKRAAWLQPRAP